MGKPINPTTVRLLRLFGERIWESVRDGKPFSYVHWILPSAARSRPAWSSGWNADAARPWVYGFEIKHGPGGVVISG